jgi:carboxypeptidase Taq
VIIRFEIERDVIAGKLAVEDIAKEWNRKYKEYLGVDVPDNAHGVLQDLHWSQGYVGYFPSYVLGSMNAAQLYATLQREKPDIEANIAKGDFPVVKDWLHEKIHKWGSLYLSEELITKATGEPPNAKYFMDYLGKKYGELYGL